MEELKIYLTNWLNGYIMDADQRYETYINTHPNSEAPGYHTRVHSQQNLLLRLVFIMDEFYLSFLEMESFLSRAECHTSTQQCAQDRTQNPSVGWSRIYVDLNTN